MGRAKLGKVPRKPTRGGGEASPTANSSLFLVSCGYGLFLSYYPIGPAGTACVTQIVDSWQALLFVRLVTVASIAAVLLMWKAGTADRLVQRKPARIVSFLGANVAFVFLHLSGLLGIEEVGPYGFAVLFGASIATPNLVWFEEIHAILRERGRNVCIVVVAGSFIVGAISTFVSELIILSPAISLVSMLALVDLSWLCLWRVTSLVPGEPSDAGDVSTTFFSSFYVRVVVTGLGVVWAYEYTLASYLGFGNGFSDPVSWGVFLSGITVCLSICVLFVKSERLRTMSFGLLLRWVIALVGTSVALLPVLATYTPQVAAYMCAFIYLLVSILIIIFIAELSVAYRLTACTVFASCFLDLVIGAAVETLLFSVLSTLADVSLAQALLSAICSGCLFAIVPFLPSRTSKAGDLAQDTLPEEIPIKERTRRSLAKVAHEAGLTAREVEVLVLLVEGVSREEIAQQLSISEWTVKSHVSKIYSKLRIHSIRELTPLIMDGGDSSDL